MGFFRPAAEARMRSRDGFFDSVYSRISETQKTGRTVIEISLDGVPEDFVKEVIAKLTVAGYGAYRRDALSASIGVFDPFLNVSW